MDPFDPTSIRAGYGAIAEAYADAFGGELADLPVDRGILDDALGAAGGGPVLEAGAGPAPVARVIAGAGRTVVAADLVPEMMAVARRDVDELVGHPVPPFGGAFHGAEWIAGLLSGAGLRIVTQRRRDARPGEVPTERLYVLARPDQSAGPGAVSG